MHAIAKEHGLWDGKGKLSFVDAFSGGEYANQYYTGRRVWDGYRRFSASQKFPATYKDLKRDRPYPATAKVDAKMTCSRNIGDTKCEWSSGSGNS